MSSFTAPAPGFYGNAGRNIVRGPGLLGWNLSLYKHFKYRERLDTEFRAESFNVFNHTEYAWLGGGNGSAASNSPFASSNNTLQNDGVLRPASAHAGRILQLGAKFIF